MIHTKIRQQIENLSIIKDIPKLIFIIQYIVILISGLIFFKIIEINNKDNYIHFFKDRVAIIHNQDQWENADLENYYIRVNQFIAETWGVKNIAFIVWGEDGKVLWHSNKLIEKVVENNDGDNNKLIKGMSLLDIPEKKFQPYESFRFYREKLKTDPIIVDFKKNMVVHFYKLPQTKPEIYIEFLREYDGIVPGRLYVYLIVLALIASGLLTYLANRLLHIYLSPVQALNTSMQLHTKIAKNEFVLNNYGANEIGQLVLQYNSFVHRINSMHDDRIEDKDGKNQRVVDYLQQMLLKKSIRKSDQMELLLYPKHPENDFRMFVTIEEKNNVTFILYVHFDINNIESNIEKHIIQDKFKDLFSKSDDIDELAAELFKDFVAHADLGPGFLLIRLEADSFDWVKCGPFHLYTVDSMSGESSLLEGGVDYLPAEMISKENTELGDKLLIVISADIMDLMNVDATEFNNMVLWFPEQSTRDGRLILTQILNNINIANPDVLHQSPLITLTRLKNQD